MKKLFITLLCVVMVAVFMPTMAFAEETPGPLCENTTTGKTYTDLAAASAEAQDGDTLKLLRAASKFTLDNGKTLTVDLGTFTLSGITIKAGFLTVKNGVITADVWLYANGDDAPKNSFTLAADARINGDYGIVVTQNEVGPDNYGTTVNIDGEINGTSSALWVLGNIKTDLETAKNPVVVNVGSTAKMTNVSPDKDGTALQMAGACVVTVEKGAEITGPTAIEVRAGNLIVNGGKITATAEPTESSPNGNGTSTQGAGIGVAQHTTNLPISVTVNDAEVAGHTAIYVTNPQNNIIENNKVTATVNGGSFIATNDEKNPIARDNNAVGMPITVTGGTFSGDVVDYLAPDASYVESSTSYGVGADAKVLVENAKEGETLTLHKYDGEITLPEGVSIDNQTGAPVTVNGDTVESGGTLTTTHDVKAVDAIAATCTETGNIAYWICELCGKYYSDAACTKEIALEATVIPANGHGETELKDTKEATCTAEGYTGDKVCKVCGEVVEAGKVVEKTAHSYEDGKCTVCGAADPDYKPATDPGDTTDPDKDVPETDDNTNLAFYLLLMLAAGISVTGTAVYSRKK